MVFLDNITIKRKLLGGFLILIIMAIIISYIGFSAMGTMTQKADQMYSERLVALEGLLNADNSFLNIRINIYKTVFAKDERKDKFEEIDREIANIKEKITNYGEKATTDQERLLVNTFMTNWSVFEPALIKIMDDMDAGREEAALEGIYSNDFSIPRDNAQDALDTLEEYNQEQSRILKDEIAQLYQQSSLTFIVITIIATVFGIGFGLILTNSITTPLAQTMEMIREMGKGHLGMRLKMARKDEIGQMSSIMDDFAENLQVSVIGTMKKIAAGEKISSTPIMDDRDEIGPALAETVQTLNNLIHETDQLTRGAVAGNLSVRGDGTRFKGAYQEIIRGINLTLENIVLPLNEGMKVAGRYAAGDFSARFSDSLEVRGDFIPFKTAMDTIGIDTGKAIKSVTQEVYTLMSGMEETNASVEEISAGSQTLAVNAGRVSDFSEKSAQGIQQILAAMGDLATAVSAVATDSSLVASRTQETDDLSAEGRVLVGKTEEGMKTIKTSFEETSHVVTEINEQMVEIGSIVGVIGGIADQTNLLALNAAIEAARAGEAGLGFAVVAEEVKALAEESRQSAEKIADLISDLQKKSRNVTESMNQSLEDVSAGDAAVKETLAIFEKIAESIADVTRRISEVAGTTQEQAASVEEISASVHEVGSLIDQTAKEAVDSSAAAEQTSAGLDQITQVVNAATESIGQISQSMAKFTV